MYGARPVEASYVLIGQTIALTLLTKAMLTKHGRASLAFVKKLVRVELLRMFT